MTTVLFAFQLKAIGKNHSVTRTCKSENYANPRHLGGIPKKIIV